MSPFIDKVKTRYSCAFFQSLFSANFRDEPQLNKLAENRDVLSSFFCTNLPLVFVETNYIIKMEMNKCNFDSRCVHLRKPIINKEQNNEENNFDFFTLTHDDFL